jgi:hypothetical protein
MGWSLRERGFRTRPRFSSVTTPKSGWSPFSPRMTGVCPSASARAMCASETLRSMVVPSARAKSSVRLGFRPSRFHTISGSSVYDAPLSTRKRSVSFLPVGPVTTALRWAVPMVAP